METYAIHKTAMIKPRLARMTMDLIRGKSVENPVLLFISGGPGVPQYWLNEYYDNKIEDYFTVCWWDYRGEGLSYDSELTTEDITLEQLEKDAVEVAEYLKERFGKEKIYLMAHSGGTMLGLRLAQNYPENFYCYFASLGKCSNTMSFSCFLIIEKS